MLIGTKASMDGGSYPLLIRADASVQIGTGHVMRCITLADKLRERGAEAIFVCREFEGNLCGYIEKKGYIVHRLPVSVVQKHNIEGNLKHATWLGADWQTDARLVEKIIKDLNTPPDWLVVDHYALDKRWEGYLRLYCKKIMIIDDLADRAHDCDLLLDQNFYENMGNRHEGLVPTRSKKLLGPKYALLRPEFREARKNLRKRDGHVKKIMIFFGGSDPTNETAKVLEAIRILKRPDIAVDVVVGGTNPNNEKINELCSVMTNVAYYCHVENMAQLMVDADLFIGGGGSTTWERCCLGLPSLIISTAINQNAIAVGCDQSGIGIHINKSKDISPHQIQIEIEKMLLNQNVLLTMGKKSANMVDCRGVDYVASFLMDCEKQ